MKSDRANLKENADDFEMRVEFVRHAFSIMAGRCYHRVGGKCAKLDPAAPCAIGSCPLLREVEKPT